MNVIDSGTITALERSDIKRYPNEIDGVANRGAAAPVAARSVNYSESAAEISDRPSAVAASAPVKAENFVSL